MTVWINRIPSFLQHGEDGLTKSVLREDAVAVFEEGASPLFGGIWECVEPIESLTEKGVSAGLDDLGFEQVVQACSVGSDAQECEERDGAEKKELVSTTGVSDADLGQSESEMRAFSVEKGLFVNPGNRVLGAHSDRLRGSVARPPVRAEPPQ